LVLLLLLGQLLLLPHQTILLLYQLPQQLLLVLLVLQLQLLLQLLLVEQLLLHFLQLCQGQTARLCCSLEVRE